MKQKSDNWGTPDSIYSLLPQKTYFDPCPADNQHAQQYGGVIITRHLSKIDARDYQNLKLLNYINPPFSDPEPFVQSAYLGWSLGGKSSIVCLPDFTDRKWWLRTVQPNVDAGNMKCLFVGRHNFVPLDGQKESGPKFGVALLFIGFHIITEFDYSFQKLMERKKITAWNPYELPAKQSQTLQ